MTIHVLFKKKKKKRILNSYNILTIDTYIYCQIIVMIVTLLPTWPAIIILMISQIIKDHFLSTANLIIMMESLKAHHVVS